MSKPALLKLDPRPCPICGERFDPMQGFGGWRFGLKSKLVRCKECAGRGCRRCAPASLRYPPERASTRGTGFVHDPDCRCSRCAQYDPVEPSRIKTCGADECVSEWRRTLGGEQAVRPKKTADELRDDRLALAKVPAKFRGPLNYGMLNHGRGAKIVTKQRAADGTIVKLSGDILNALRDAESPHVYIWGRYQIGKSRIAADLVARGLETSTFSSAYWTSTQRLATALAEHRLGSTMEAERRAVECRVLVVDDLLLIGDTARAKEAEQCLERILQVRWDEAQPTITTASVAPRSSDNEEVTLEKALPWYYARIKQALQVAVFPLSGDPGTVTR